MWTFKSNFYLYLVFLLQLYCCDEISSEWSIKTKCSNTAMERIFDKHGLELVTKVGENEYIVRHSMSETNSKHGEITDWKELPNEECVKNVEQQNWIKRVARSITINDLHWNDMWYLNGNTTPNMGVLHAWENGYTGKGINIAIVDDGVDYNHPDIQPNYDQRLSFDIVNNNSHPLSTTYTHGTECAGVALAAKNNKCIVGIAYDSKLAAIRVLGTKPLNAAMIYDALYRPDIDIYSIHWIDLPEEWFKEDDNLVKSAFEKGIAQGRKGLGSVYILGTDTTCNGDSFVHNLYTIGVGSVTKALTANVYKACSAIMVSAYGGDDKNKIWTTSTKNRCIQSKNLATPMVAGIIALIFEANSNLTWRDIQHLIVNTSDLSLLKNGNTQINGAGIAVSDYYGFGLINAEKLTTVAKVWKNVQPQRKCLQNVTRDGGTTTNLNYELSINYTANACENTTSEVLKLEHVQIYVRLEYTQLQAVTLDITSPSNTTSQLLTLKSVNRKNDTLQWTFLSVHFWGENPIGIWTLKMRKDTSYYRDTATLVEWNMTFYGTTIEDHYPKPKTTKKPTTTISQPTSSSLLKQTTLSTNSTNTTSGTTNSITTANITNITNTPIPANAYMDNDSSQSSLSTGAITGIVIGVIIVIVLIVVGIIIYIKYFKK